MGIWGEEAMTTPRETPLTDAIYARRIKQNNAYLTMYEHARSLERTVAELREYARHEELERAKEKP